MIVKSCRKWDWLGILLCVYLAAGLPARAQDDAPSPETSEQNCHLTHLATIDLKAELKDRIVFPVSINGHEMLFMLDTGSPVSGLSGATFKALDIPLDINLSRRMFEAGATGAKIVMAAKVSDFEIGGMKGKDFILGIVPNTLLGPRISGLLGADIIRNFDIELDFGANKMNLFAPDHCPGKVVYWTQQPFAAVPFEFDYLHHLIIPVRLDNVPLQAEVDTGAPKAVHMNLDRARALFGWYTNPPVLATIDAQRGWYFHQFELLSLAGASVRNPSAQLEDKLDIGAPDLLVGLDALKAFHVYISYKDKAIYLTARDAH